MNRLIPRIGAGIVCVTVALFALCMLIGFDFGSYFVCMLLPIGYIMLAAGFAHECDASRKVASNVGMVLAAVYAVLVLLVYFAQNTSVRLDDLGEQALGMLDFKRGGLMFSYDLLGYGMMALSTFFVGLGISPKNRADRWLKGLMMLHGVFFLSCFILPMTGLLGGSSDGVGGVVALELWCAYFLPIGVLAFIHFAPRKTQG